MQTDLKDLTLHELEAFIAGCGKERYRARQIFRWLYRRGATTFAQMTDLAQGFREELKRIARISSLQPTTVESSPDGTQKYLFELEDGNAVESVLIPNDGRLTLCISTQVGCAMGCRFCLTGKGGFTRNLTCSEIINQLVWAWHNLTPQRRISNCVFMGMGEPLANYEAVKKAISIMASTLGFGLSRRRITLSTVGVIPQIKRLFAEGVPCRLAISLNAPNQKLRSYLMPVATKYPLHELLTTCRSLPLPPRERITFEYVLIAGINDAEKDAKELAKILRGIRCKVNLIPFNECPGIEFRRPNDLTVLRFQQILINAGYTAIIRESRGVEISAACGQLRGRIKQP